MFLKLIKLIISTTFLLFVNQSFNPAYSIDCDLHFSRPTSSKKKDVIKEKKAEKQSDKFNKKKSKVKKYF